jgi:hypothetical protein
MIPNKIKKYNLNKHSTHSSLNEQEVANMIKKIQRLMAVVFALKAMEFPMMAAVPNFIAKQGKGVFLFNVAVILIIVGFAGYLVWKKKNNDGGDE